MGNTTSNNSFTDVEKQLINELQDTLNTSTETFRPKNQDGGIITWNTNDEFITPEGLRGKINHKRTEPSLITKDVYEVVINGKVETMWPKRDMRVPPEVLAKREEELAKELEIAEENKKKLAAERAIQEEKRREAAAEAAKAYRIQMEINKRDNLVKQEAVIQDRMRHKNEIAEKRQIQIQRKRLENLKKFKSQEDRIRQQIAIEEQNINLLQSSAKPEEIKTVQRQRSTSTIKGLTQELNLINKEIAELEKSKV